VQKRLITTIVVGGIAAAMVLSGCSNSSKSTGSGLASGGTSPSASASGSGAGAACNGTGPSYKIAFQGPLSGDEKNLGVAEVNAVQLAIDQANAAKNLCFQLALLQSDDQCATGPAPAAAAAVIQDPAVVGLIGPSCSGATTATAKSYAQAGIAIISPSATNETLTDPSNGFTTFHRIVPTDGVEGKATADFLAGKYKSVFVVDDSTTYGQGVAQVVRAELKAKGVKVDSQSFAQTVKDFSTLATKIQQSGDQAMYMGGYYAQAGLLAKALNAVGYKGFEIAGNGAKDPGFVVASGAAGDGFNFACGCLDATTAPSAAAFNTAYTAKFGTPPSTYSPESFDATNAMITAISAAFKAGNGTATRAAVETAVGALDYSGITTTVKFLPSGEVAQATINLYKVESGKIVLLGDLSKQ
jgi:branched-chain amino acid transport system substrate-binding protein